MDSLLSYHWIIPAVLVCVLASIASGLCGAYVVSRRINNAAGGIAHIVLGGAGISFFLGIPLLVGSFLVVMVGALLIGFISLRMPEHEDLVINALWASSMAMGIILLAKTPSLSIDFSAYLFGSVLLANWNDVGLLLLVNVILLMLIALFQRAFLALTFDREFAESRGLPVKYLHYLMLMMIALTVVALVRVVGIVFVIALLTVPIAIAELFCHTLRRWMITAIAINLICSIIGLSIAFYADFPVSATIVLLLGVSYLIIVAFFSMMKQR